MSDERRNQWRQVRVTFRKAVSDGNYGTESAEVTLEDWIDTVFIGEDEESYTAMAAASLRDARALVQAELERSSSQRVRSAIDHSV